MGEIHGFAQKVYDIYADTEKIEQMQSELTPVEISPTGCMIH